MKQLIPAVTLNLSGLAIAVWGVMMLVGIYAPIRSMADGTVAAIGLGVLAVGM